jgi:hypothetical protein
LSADISDKTQTQKEDSTQLGERKKKQEELSKKLDETTALCAKQKAEYEGEAADLSKAIQGLKDAIKAMSDSKPSSFLEIKKSLGKTFEIAEAMNLLKTQKHKAVGIFLQQSASVTQKIQSTTSTLKTSSMFARASSRTTMTKSTNWTRSGRRRRRAAMR